MMIYTEFSAAQRWPECSYKCLKLCPNQTSRGKVFSPATTHQKIETVSKIESAVRTKTQINMEKIPFIMSQHRVASDQDTIIIKQYLKVLKQKPPVGGRVIPSSYSFKNMHSFSKEELKTVLSWICLKLFSLHKIEKKLTILLSF